MPLNKRLRDLSLEILIGLALVAGIALFAIYVPRSHRVSARWVGLAVMTLIAFGYPLRWYRSYWRRALFWVAFLGLLLIHLAAFVVVLREVERFGLLWFAILTPLEWTLIRPILERTGRASGKIGGPGIVPKG